MFTIKEEEEFLQDRIFEIIYELISNILLIVVGKTLKNSIFSLQINSQFIIM
jgi:hypothetical protein